MSNTNADLNALALKLRDLWNAKKFIPTIGGQMLGLEQYRLTASGQQFEALLDASDALTTAATPPNEEASKAIDQRAFEIAERIGFNHGNDGSHRRNLTAEIHAALVKFATTPPSATPSAGGEKEAIEAAVKAFMFTFRTGPTGTTDAIKAAIWAYHHTLPHVTDEPLPLDKTAFQAAWGVFCGCDHIGMDKDAQLKHAIRTYLTTLPAETAAPDSGEGE